MGPFVVWIMAIVFSWSGINALRTSAVSSRFTRITLAFSAFAGLLAGAVALSAVSVVGAAAMTLLLFGMTSYTIVKQVEARNHNRERIRELFEEHPEMYEKFQNHWFFARQVRRFDEKKRKRRDR